MRSRFLPGFILFVSFLIGTREANAQISGTVYNDVNGLTDNSVNGTGANGGGLFAVLVNNTTGNVADAVAVPANGTYSFSVGGSADYKILITTNTATIGNTPPAVDLPANWVSTGEYLGSGSGDDGTVDGMLSLGTVSSATDANFGMEELPATNVSTATSVTNPGGTNAVTLLAGDFGATDPSGGTIDSILIASFPTFTTTFSVNSTSYTSASFPAAGLFVPTTANGQPTQTITLDPQNGSVSAVITYAAVDNAAQIDMSAGSLTIPFKDSISGAVFNDANGLLGTPVNTIDGNGSNAGGTLNAVLVNTITGNVTATTAVASNGFYSMTGMDDGTYEVLITTNTATVGNPAPTVTLPTGWVNTGEFIGGPGNDGTIDGILSIGTIDSNVAKVNFGIEQLPSTTTNVANSQPNPGGTTSAAIDATYFGGTDPGTGYIDSLLIQSFPTFTTTITINGTAYTSTTFPATGVMVPTNAAGEPTQTIEIDPVNGNVNVVIAYTVRDNAGMFDPVGGTLTLPFNPGLVYDGSTAQELASALTGTGVIVLNPVLNGTCPDVARGMFNFYGAPSDIGIDSGIVLTSGRVVTNGFQYGINTAAINFATYSFPGGSPYAPGDADLNTLLSLAGSNATTNDACVLEFDFVPAGDSIKFQYVFGSEEYPEYACTGFNDVFGFFISGPGFTGLNNIAKIPNTNIPVAINTINMGAGSAGGDITTCNAMGTGSPFSQYYIDNLGNNNQTIAYDGFTTVLTALSPVSPCDTYHLKLAIADAGDGGYDSGVFLKAGSLSSTAITVKTFGGAGLETPFTNTVRGCPPGVVRVGRTGNLNQPITIPLSFSGTAVNGTDYQPLANSVTIPAGDSVVNIYVNGIPVSPATGPKSCIIAAISPYTCNGDTIILSSDTIMIYDSIYVNILNPDTVICAGESVDLDVEADSMLEFTWTPVATVDDPSAQDVTVTPTTATSYTVSVNLPLITGCPPSTDHVFIDVKEQPQVDLGIDKVTCGDAVQLYAATTPQNPDETFSWSPAAGLSNDTIRDPLATITTTTQYAVTVNPGAVGCDGHDTISVLLLPDHINILNPDTAVCAGTVIQLRTDGDDHFSYNWTPEQDIADDTLKNTTLTAQQSGYYTLTASYPGCVDMPDSVYVEVQPVAEVNVGPDRTICTYDTIQLYASVMPSGYPDYQYSWNPGENLTDSMIQSPVFSGDGSVRQIVKVTTPLGCTNSDTMQITVHPGDFLQVAPVDTAGCPPAELRLHAEGGVSYVWTPSWGLDDATSSDPTARPETTTEYQVVGTSDRNCLDTGLIYFEVYPSAVINLPDSVTIWPGESYQMDPQGNALYFSWFPHSGMSAYDISNPIAYPQVRTRYFVTASTEAGCVVKDSIDVLVNTESVLDAPNAFTPGHGSNGIFKISIRGLATLKYFRVYNRWGNLVFETTDVNEGWDGSYNGKPQPVGVYVYSIEAVTSAGTTFRKNGNVTLIR